MKKEFSLNGLWRFRGYKDSNGETEGAHLPEANTVDWLPAKVPSTVHTDLMENNLIDNPFKDANEKQAQWVSEYEWWYRKEIDLPPDIASKEAVELVFEGLDTFATVWVNGIKVGEANNMFTPWRFNIKEKVKAGKNHLAVAFKPIYVVAYSLEQQHMHKYSCLSSENCSARPYVRKAQYSFGWDWGPTLPSTGIWREAKLVAYEVARLGYVSALPLEVSKEKAKVLLSAEINAVKTERLNVEFVLEGFGQKIKRLFQVEVTEGRNLAEYTFDVLEPRLWWPRGYGEPSLYDASVKVYSGESLLDEASFKVGVRSVELVQEPDEEGTSFIFRINGLNVFCKGANWIPADSFLSRVTLERYNKLIRLCNEANFNMLRVWGGGIYEADDFYALCDKIGILVWQDFMYVCAGYPEEDWFLREAKREAEEAVLRLRGHPSIVLWCGNNENQWLHNVLWRVRDKVERLYGLTIYESLLLEVCKRLDPTRPYRPSSPFGGEDSSGKHEGDRHNWEVWSQGLDYPSYQQDNGRFISEFGWQSLPSMKVLASYLEEEELTPHSNAFRIHEKQTGGLELLRALLAIHYPVPTDIQHFVLYSQLNQADALKTAVSHWRSRMFKTSGCLIWQLNDCWPAISWSLIDYGANTKPAYYAVKRAFQPLIAPLILRNGQAQIYVVNETKKVLDSTLKFQVMTFSGDVLASEQIQTVTPAYSSLVVMRRALESLPLGKNCIMVVSLESKGTVIFEDVKTAVEPKDLSLPAFDDLKINVSLSKPKMFRIALEFSSYAKGVWLRLKNEEGEFSDNFFDMVPNHRKIVKCALECDVGLDEFQRSLLVSAYPYKE